MYRGPRRGSSHPGPGWAAVGRCTCDAGVRATAPPLRRHLVPRGAACAAAFPRLQAKIVARYIEEHLDEKLRLAELAQVAHVSVNHFLRQFKLSFGCAPHVYVIQRRLEYATHLLAKTRLPIKDVAAHSGFADQSHMSRAFQQYLRTTPGAFRDTIAVVVVWFRLDVFLPISEVRGFNTLGPASGYAMVLMWLTSIEGSRECGTAQTAGIFQH